MLAGLWILVVAWNRWEDTERCLRSLLPSAERGARVVVVDNGSEDGTQERCRSGFPFVEVIRSDVNLGFGAGNNLGIRRALRGGARNVVLLNNDTWVEEEFATHLLLVAASDRRIGGVSSKIFYADRPDVLWFAGGDFSTTTGRITHRGMGERDRGQFDGVGRIGRPCACALLLSREFLQSFGEFDESLFAYGEEAELTLHARRAGFEFRLAARSRVWHRVSGSSGGARSADPFYYSTRNVLRVLDRRDAVRTRALGRVREVLVTSAFLVGAIRGGGAPWRRIGAVVAGFWDFRRRRFGPRRPPAAEAPGGG